jgi:hypothetical protein
MEKFMKMPLYIPLIGLIVSFALLIFVANVPNMPLLITGIILMHLSGWLLAAKYLICGVTAFSSVLSTK